MRYWLSLVVLFGISLSLVVDTDAKPKPKAKPTPRAGMIMPSDEVLRSIPKEQMDAMEDHRKALLYEKARVEIAAAIAERDTVNVELAGAKEQIKELGRKADKADYWEKKHGEAAKKLWWWRLHAFGAGIIGIGLLVLSLLLYTGKIAARLR